MHEGTGSSSFQLSTASTAISTQLTQQSGFTSGDGPRRSVTGANSPDNRQRRQNRRSQLEEGSGPVAEENLRLREELLLARDDIVGHEARLGEALGRIEVLEAELRRHQDALAGAERILGSRSGRLLRAWHRVRALLR